MKTTQQRIDEIIKTTKNYVGSIDTLTEELLTNQLEALVLQAKREQLDEQLEQLKK